MTDMPLGINLSDIVSSPQANTTWPALVIGTIAAFVKSMTGCTKTRAVEVAEEVFKDHHTDQATAMGYMVMVEEAMTKAAFGEDGN